MGKASMETAVVFLIPAIGSVADTSSLEVDPRLHNRTLAVLRQHAPALLVAPGQAPLPRRPGLEMAPVHAPRAPRR